MADAIEATRLKEEGNKHFEKKEFSQAYDKYTAALETGGENAILYANRAACLLSQRKFLDATNDAEKATTLDPTYSKGWGRLGAAYLGQLRAKPAIPAFKNAIAYLPKSGRTPAQQKQRKQYEDGLREAEELMLPKAAENIVYLQKDKMKDGPLEKALEMLKDLDIRPVPTSAWVIGKAYEDWQSGLKDLQALKEIKAPDGTKALTGSFHVLASFTNAVLRDSRVFHAGEGWLESIEKQCVFEGGCCNIDGWHQAGPKIVLKEAQDRVSKDGWDAKPDESGQIRGGTRMAISTQVRIWIMRAFILDGLKRDNLATETLYRDTLDFLEEGRKIWRHVSKDDRGTVFEDTFVRGIRVLHLHAFLKATMSSMKGKYTLGNLFELAKGLFDEASAANQNRPLLMGVDFGFIASFYTYPIGDALSTMALCYRRMAHNESDESKKKDQMWKAGQLYHQSANYYFDDDEHFSYFMAKSLGAYWHSGAGLAVTLPIMKVLQAAVPKMKLIWEHSTSAEGGREEINICLGICDEVLRKISRRELKEDSPYIPNNDIIRIL